MPDPATISAGALLLGKLFGGGARGAADERLAQNNAQSSFNNALLQRFGLQQSAIQQALGQQERGALDRAGLDLQRRGFALNAPNVRGRQAIIGSLLQNLQPASFGNIPEAVRSKMPQLSGGLSAAALGPEARQFGALLARQALLQQLQGDHFDPVPQTNFLGGLIKPPDLQGPKGPGGFERFLSIGSLLGNIVGGLGGLQNGGRNDFMAFDRTPPVPPPPVRT